MGINLRDLMWGFELYLHEHPEDLAKFPLVCKALYDEDLFEEAEFIAYYENDESNKELPSHGKARKQIGPFVTWLKEDSSDSDSD